MQTEKISLILLFIVALINFAPILGVVSVEKINQAYDLNVGDNNLAILLRHRALLFGILGGFLFYSLFNPSHQTAAIVLVAISMFGYLYFIYSIGNANAALMKVAYIDIVAIVLLLIALAIKYVNA